MATYYLAVDIGASSGRHILGHMENGKMILEEVYRFENGMVKKGDELCWEFDRLFKEVFSWTKTEMFLETLLDIVTAVQKAWTRKCTK